MDEHLCRGKRVGNKEWIEGYFVRIGPLEKEKTYIIPVYASAWYGAEVEQSTIGRHTGLTDKNGVKIFEGDIVKFKHGGEFSNGGIYFRNYAVEYVNTFVHYGLRLRNRSVHFPFKQATAATHDVVVIGNIHDNPELLEEES